MNCSSHPWSTTTTKFKQSGSQDFSEWMRTDMLTTQDVKKYTMTRSITKLQTQFKEATLVTWSTGLELFFQKIHSPLSRCVKKFYVSVMGEDDWHVKYDLSQLSYSIWNGIYFPIPLMLPIVVKNKTSLLRLGVY